MTEKIQIRSRYDEDVVLFEHEQKDNTIKETVLAAVKEGVSLSGSYFFNADLSDIDLSGIDLSDSAVLYSRLANSDLCQANLKNTIFSRCDLSYVDFCEADLSGVWLKTSNISNADFQHAYNVPYIPIACPSDGSFIAWKKVVDQKQCQETYMEHESIIDKLSSNDAYLIKLEIPEDAKRSSATTNKCRCDKAKVLKITHLKTGETIEEVTTFNDCVYKVGEMIYPDRFDDNRWNECSNGIHFFINKEEAIEYTYMHPSLKPSKLNL